jgi:hypothetical protein
MQKTLPDLRRFAFEHPLAAVPRGIVIEQDYFLDMPRRGLRLSLSLNR